MTLKNAALFALLAMALLTVVLTVNLIVNVSGVMRGFIPPVTLLTSLIQWLASVSVFVFFLVFHRTQ
jgi:glucan phosphoethanolaminetransferase (alkaline phosphatase superfamily)